MEKFSKIHSTAVPLPIENVDTDQIIPARFLRMISADGFGEFLFNDWRYHKNGDLVEDFVLNNRLYKGDILVAGKNFGCGSSREHAPWAILQYGFKAVISSEFADIFKNNALNNGLLPIEVSEDFLDSIFRAIENNPQTEFTIELESQEIQLGHRIARFQIDPFRKECLLKGMDILDYLLSLEKEITSFENHQKIY